MVTKTKKELAELWLGDVPQDKVFWFYDGRMAKNLDELATTLRKCQRKHFNTMLLETKTISAAGSGMSSAM